MIALDLPSESPPPPPRLNDAGKTATHPNGVALAVGARSTFDLKCTLATPHTKSAGRDCRGSSIGFGVVHLWLSFVC